MLKYIIYIFLCYLNELKVMEELFGIFMYSYFIKIRLYKRKISKSRVTLVYNSD